MKRRISRLERRRRKLGFRQKDLAKVLKVNPSLIALIETGRMKPYPRIKKELSRILDCSEEYLFGKDKEVK